MSAIKSCRELGNSVYLPRVAPLYLEVRASAGVSSCTVAAPISIAPLRAARNDRGATVAHIFLLAGSAQVAWISGSSESPKAKAKVPIDCGMEYCSARDTSTA